MKTLRHSVLNSKGVSAAGLLLLCGCLVLPIAPHRAEPGYYGSRDDLGEQTLTFITPGTTSRQQVLEHLGPADVEAIDQRWAYYQSDYVQRETGVWVLWYVGFLDKGAAGVDSVPVRNEALFRRLEIDFDAEGTVTAMHSDSGVCALMPWGRRTVAQRLAPPDEHYGDEELASCPILKRGRELRARRMWERMRAAAPDADESAARVAEGIALLTNKHRTLLGFPDWEVSDLRYAAIVSSRYVAFLPIERLPKGVPLPPRVFDRDDIVSAQPLSGNPLGIELQLRDGKVLGASLEAAGMPKATVEAWLRFSAELQRRSSSK